MRVDRVVCLSALLLLGAAGVRAEEPLFRHRAPIAVEQGGAFVRLPLPVSAYAHSEQRSLQDLRVVDARGERVPFALLAPRPDEARTREEARPAALYPLPPRPSASTAWPAPLELTIQGDRISVRTRAPAPAAAASAPPPPGWVIDLGERARDPPVPQSLQLQWSGPAEFSVGLSVETSEDLKLWRPAGHGQLLSLASAAGTLTQPGVVLPAAPGRFVRLVWSDAAAAPRLSGANAVTVTQLNVNLDPPTELGLAAKAVDAGTDANLRGALDFDLGAVLPLLQIDLELGAGTHIAPVRLQGRSRADEPWQTLAGAVFYRIEREGAVTRSPPLTLTHNLRYLRVVPDPRAGALDAAQTQLRARTQLSSVVFAAQGQAPYTLLAGAAKAPAGALPLATLVPALDEERARFGRAALGTWSEDDTAVRQAESARRRAALRPWLLWGVLLGGVLLLGVLVWRLARSPRSGAAGG